MKINTILAAIAQTNYLTRNTWLERCTANRDCLTVYQLIDFGDGRKLESIDRYVIDRPCPAAIDCRSALPDRWREFGARFTIDQHHHGRWEYRKRPPENWLFSDWFGSLRLNLTDFGHLGVFPEQNTIWRWLRHLELPAGGLRLLNLFAYTGGTTLAAAKIGCEVVHVDAARNIVRRAFDNARNSGLIDRPIRWIVDDAQKYLQRQSRRAAEFDGFIIDPPTYGHGTGKSRWQINEDLPMLVGQLRTICRNCKLIVFTCHSPGYDELRLRQCLLDEFADDLPSLQKEIETGELVLHDASNRQLPAGFFARWYRGEGH